MVWSGERRATAIEKAGIADCSAPGSAQTSDLANGRRGAHIPGHGDNCPMQLRR
jgi:hypothetical protein